MAEAANEPRTWLFKSEPDVFSIDDLRRKRHAPWDGVRNYTARNFLRDQVAVGDLVLFYHSSTEPPGVVGLARVREGARPDLTAFDRKSDGYDPKSDPDNPRWVQVEVEFVAKFARVVTLAELKADPTLRSMLVVQRGQRLSIQPVERAHYDHVVAISGLGEAGVKRVSASQASPPPETRKTSTPSRPAKPATASSASKGSRGSKASRRSESPKTPKTSKGSKTATPSKAAKAARA